MEVYCRNLHLWLGFAERPAARSRSSLRQGWQVSEAMTDILAAIEARERDVELTNPHGKPVEAGAWMAAYERLAALGEPSVALARALWERSLSLHAFQHHAGPDPEATYRVCQHEPCVGDRAKLAAWVQAGEERVKLEA